MIVTVVAMSYQSSESRGGTERQRCGLFYYVENAMVVLPFTVFILSMVFPIWRFFHYKRRELNSFYMAQRFRDLMVLIAHHNNAELTQLIEGLDDEDHATIKRTMSIFYAQALHLQPSRHLRHQRLIQEANRHEVRSDLRVLSDLEAVLLDKNKNYMNGTQERALVQWVLDELHAGAAYEESLTSQAADTPLSTLNLSKRDASGAVGSNSPTNSGVDYGWRFTDSGAVTAKPSVGGSPPAARVSSLLKNGGGDSIPGLLPRALSMPHIKTPANRFRKRGRYKRDVEEIKSLGRLFDSLDADGDGLITEREFITGGRRLAPMCTDAELLHVYQVFDTDQCRIMSRMDFNEIFQNMVFGWVSSSPEALERAKKAGDQYLADSKQGRQLLMRLAAKTDTNGQTLEWMSRRARALGAVRWAQRTWRARQAERRALSAVETNHQPDTGNGHKCESTIVDIDTPPKVLCLPVGKQTTNANSLRVASEHKEMAGL